MAESVLLGLFDFIFEGIPSIITFTSKGKKITKERNKARNEEMKKSKEQAVGEEITENMYNDCAHLSNGNYKLENVFISKALAANELINWVFYYLLTLDAKLIKMDDDEKHFVNAIVNFIAPSFGRIYTDTYTGRITDYATDYISSRYTGKYIVNLVDLTAKRDSYDNFDEKVRAKFTYIEEEKIKLNTPKSQEPKNSPIIIKDAGTQYPVVKPENMPVKVYEACNMAFSRFLRDVNHYNYYSDPYGNWYLNIFYNDNPYDMDGYMIDTGMLFGGNRVSLMCNKYDMMAGYDTVFVDVENHPDIIHRVIHNPHYMLTSEEATIANADHFSNSKIYHNIDFSGMEIMDKMTSGELNKIEYYLSKVLELLDADIRLRFKTFDSPESFVLISDKNVNTPLAYNGATSDQIIPGCKFMIAGNKITKIAKEGATPVEYSI